MSKSDEQQGMTLEQGFALLHEQTGISTESLSDMYDAVMRDEPMANFFGFDEDTQNAVENIALAYYRGNQFKEAVAIFEALVGLSQGLRASAWRGLGACMQSQGHYHVAIAHYGRALSVEPSDVRSAIFSAECLILGGHRNDGVAMLREILARLPHGEAAALEDMDVLRARAIVAQGDMASPGGPVSVQGQGALALMGTDGTLHTPSGTAQSVKAPPTPAERQEALEYLRADARMQALVDAIVRGDAGKIDDEANDAEVNKMVNDPAMRPLLAELSLKVRTNQVTVKEIMGFEDQQMTAGYRIACKHLERDEIGPCMELTGWLLSIDSHDTRLHQLAGLCAHRLQLFCLADYFYNLVGIWNPHGKDPATLIYQGESKMMQNDATAAFALLTDGVKHAERDASLFEIAKRGRLLLKELKIAQAQG